MNRTPGPALDTERLDESDALPPGCAAAIEKLVDGVGVASDGDLRAHVSSCIGCYRASIELADVLRLSAALVEAEDLRRDQSTPGDDLFWARLHRRTVTSLRVSPRKRQRFVTGAAITLALGAAAAWVLMLEGSGRESPSIVGPAGSDPGPPSGALADLGGELPEDEPELPALDGVELQALHRSLGLAAEEDLAGEVLGEDLDPLVGLGASAELVLLDDGALAGLSRELLLEDDPLAGGE